MTLKHPMPKKELYKLIEDSVGNPGSQEELKAAVRSLYADNTRLKTHLSNCLQQIFVLAASDDSRDI